MTARKVVKDGSYDEVPTVAQYVAQSTAEFPDSLDPLALAFTLTLMRVVQVFDEAVDVMCSEFNMTNAQYRVLMVLRRSGVPITMGQLSRRVLVTSTNLTAVVDSLVERGWIDRFTNVEDRRSFLVEILPEGRSFLDDVLPVLWVQLKELTSAWSPAELKRMTALLGKFPGIDRIPKNIA